MAADEVGEGTSLADDESAVPYTWRHTIVSNHNHELVGVDDATIGDVVGHVKRGTTSTIYRMPRSRVWCRRRSW